MSTTTLARLPGALALLVLLLASPAHAQQPETRSFTIPPGPLAQALSRFAEQSDLQLVYTAELTSGLTTHGVAGRLTVEAALTRLLADTGLGFRPTGPGAITLERVTTAQQPGGAPPGPAAPPAPPPADVSMPEIRVRAQTEQTGWGPVNGYIATRSLTGTKTDTPLIETPQSISVVTKEQIAAQQAQTVGAALRYSSGILADEGPDNRFDSVSARGFALDEFLDGLKLWSGNPFASSRIEPYLLERIEVLRGPASVLYGQASPGGVLNLVSKRPTPVPLHEVVLQAGSYDRFQGAFDLGGPIDPSGRVLYRLTGLARDSSTQVDFTKEQRLAIAPALTLRFSPDTTLTILGGYQYDPEGGWYTGLPAAGTVLRIPAGRIPTSFYAGAPNNFDKYERTQYSVGSLFEHRFNENFAVRQNFRYIHVDTDFKTVFPFFGLLPDGHSLDRLASASGEKVDTIALDNQGEIRFTTGPLGHTVLVGLDYQRSSWAHRGGDGFAPPIDFLNPDYRQPIPEFVSTFRVETMRHRLGVYAQDQIKLGNLVLLGGIRQDWAWARTEDLIDHGSESRRDQALTGRGGIVYVFDIGVAPYFSYAESFEPTAGTDFDGHPFAPTTGRQFELGVKYQPKGFPGFITVAVFELTRQNVLTADPDHPFFSVQTGEIRSRGVELEAKVTPLSGFNVLANFAYLDSVVTKSNDIDLHQRPVGVPKVLGSIWGDYTVLGGPLAGLGVGVGVRYTGDTAGDFGNTFDVPARTLVDGAIRYAFGAVGPRVLNGLQLSVNISNAFDREYVASCGSESACFYGLRRTVLGTVSYRW